MATARDLIKGSMRLIGAIASGETPSAAELADGLSALNDMLKSWSTQRLLVPVRTREEFAVSVSPITMGPGATLDAGRPLKIDAAAIMVGTSEVPLRVLTPEEWQTTSLKSLASSLPNSIYTDGTYPNETLNLWPKPSGNVTLVLYSWKALETYASANSTSAFPDGYDEAIKYNLAIRLAPEYGRAIPGEIASVAVESLANIKRMNKRPLYVVSDAFALDCTKVNSRFITGE